nr:hypothetical protein [Chroococcidiopsis sp. CCALA 051]
MINEREIIFTLLRRSRCNCTYVLHLTGEPIAVSCRPRSGKSIGKGSN